MSNETIYSVGKNIKDILRKNFTFANCIKIFAFLFIIWLILECFFEIIEMQFHYYNNTTNTIEYISGKKIDRYDGKEFKEQSTEEQLLRKMNKKHRFRLRDLRQGYRQLFP